MFAGINIFSTWFSVIKGSRVKMTQIRAWDITMTITLKGIEEKKKLKKLKQNGLHAIVYKLNGFYFPKIKIPQWAKLAGKYKILW